MPPSVLHYIIRFPSPGLAREGCSFLSARSLPKGEREKNSTKPSRSYHAAITGVIYSTGNSTSKLAQEEPTAYPLSSPSTPSAEALANPTGTWQTNCCISTGRRRGRKSRDEEVSPKQSEPPTGEHTGVTMADIPALPDQLCTLVTWLMRQPEAGLPEVAAYTRQNEASAHTMLADLVA